MKISTKTRYGFRLLTYLGANIEKESISLKEVSENENISIKYLEQIILPLKSLDILSVIRGKSGGYKLKKSANEITLLEVFEVLEGNISIVDCDNNCAKKDSCSTKKIWNSIDSLISDFLKQKKLSDLVNDYNKNNNKIMYFI